MHLFAVRKADYRIAALIGLCTGLAVIYTSGALCSDETYIYMRYVENALNGYGFTFNPGERSSGVNSPIWALLMTPLVYLFSNSIWVWKVTGAILAACRASVLYLAIKHLGVNRNLAFLLCLIGIIEPFSFHLSGLGTEASLVVLSLTIVAAALWPYVKKTSFRSAVILGITSASLPFVRPELFVFSASTLLIVLFLRKAFRHKASFYTSFFVTALFLTHTTWLMFGELIPQSFLAKALLLRHDNPYQVLGETGYLLLGSGLGALLILLVTKVNTYQSAVWSRTALWSALALVVYLFFNHQAISIDFAVILFTPFVLGALFVYAERVVFDKELPRRASCFLIIQVLLSSAFLMHFITSSLKESDSLKSAAMMIKQETGKRARIAAVNVGVIGFLSNRYIIDLSGKTDPQTFSWARANGQFNTDQDLFKLLAARNASHILQGLPSSAKAQNPCQELQSPKLQCQQTDFKHGTWRLYRVTHRP